MATSFPPTSARPHAVLLGLAASLFVADAGSAQIWAEEFNYTGAPDANVWSYDLGASGWGNSELQNYTQNPANVRVENGHLRIRALNLAGNLTSGRIRTQDKLTFQYGTIEARIRVPNMQDGLWPAFWTLGNSFGTVGWPDCGEIDVLEMGAGEAISQNLVNRRVYSTAHWESNGFHASYGLSALPPQDLDNGFHVWRLEWTPWALSTYIDGQWIWTMDISNPASFDGEEFHAPHFFIVNLAVGGTFTGIFNEGGITAPLPADLLVDYIRVFDNGHTILGGSALDVEPATATPRQGTGNLNTALFCAPPIIGETMTTFIAVGAQPYSAGGVLAHLGASTLPFGNYTILVDPTSPLVFTLPLTNFVGGTAVWNTPIPADSNLAGLEIKTQGVLAGPDIALTNAVDLVVGS